MFLLRPMREDLQHCFMLQSHIVRMESISSSNAVYLNLILRAPIYFERRGLLASTKSLRRPAKNFFQRPYGACSPELLGHTIPPSTFAIRE